LKQVKKCEKTTSKLFSTFFDVNFAICKEKKEKKKKVFCDLRTEQTMDGKQTANCESELNIKGKIGFLFGFLFFFFFCPPPQFSHRVDDIVQQERKLHTAFD
jgi:hypothetical protein